MIDIESCLDVKPTGIPVSEGRILISVPFFNDAFFNRSVVLLTDHTESGSAGLVINKSSKMTINQLGIEQLHLDAPVFLGGPVPARQLFGLHNFSECAKAQKLLPGIYVGYDAILLALIENKAIEQLKYKFFAGYSGWSAGQLDEEIEGNRWVIGNITQELLFDTPSEKIWEQAVRNLGKEYLSWLEVPRHHSDN